MTIALDYKPAQPNPFADHISGQRIALIPSLILESGHVLKSCQVAYKTWGQLNATRDNVLVVCHALSGSSDVADWWAPLMGPGKALDYTRFFVFCGNALGSPYGSSSPLTANVETGRPYGPEFPPTSIRDDVMAHKLVLDTLGVSSIAAVIGGSMGGMTTIEWPLCTPPGFVKAVIPIATSVAQSAWGISWSEVQRRCIRSDPLFRDGYYELNQQPTSGLATARMVAMLTYRSGESFEKRFGRKPSSQSKYLITPAVAPACNGPSSHPSVNPSPPPSNTPMRQFSAQDYLDYQGAKFLRRFDANCYLHLTHKMDMHDVRRGRVPEGRHRHLHGECSPPDNIIAAVLSRVPSCALVVGIESDALFLPTQQHDLAASLPDATLAMLKSPDGHDAFLLEFEKLNHLIIDRLKWRFPTMYEGFVERVADVDMSRLTNGISVGEVD
ncbi:acetyl-CoA--deacetylcephalosporin C acetyltransferase precursor [Penicillium canariense]|uniref:Acetyl-CoA--deacetylcephalosporin C acetyltransferase n=1 Tax=Penicillium canariense TaxID=189055 RepID=A0A9W9LEJ6_9EURO|nr:acetyl-CoA--deacetylcephalosporin C acetyltransferase precursor [Penicillium canariense]KAJ5152721.1 acetyl-CoA--deacetylcephalosporin C acetyltransferase precursor [Penicillium canariense]